MMLVYAGMCYILLLCHSMNAKISPPSGTRKPKPFQAERLVLTWTDNPKHLRHRRIVDPTHGEIEEAWGEI